MPKYSFIDFGARDFLRKSDGTPIEIERDNVEGAEDWLLVHGENLGWTNKGIRFWCWDDEE